MADHLQKMEQAITDALDSFDTLEVRGTKSRELSLVKTKLQEAIFWLEAHKEQVDGE